jgi:beta-lactam-binding protein with PASTA domain
MTDTDTDLDRWPTQADTAVAPPPPPPVTAPTPPPPAPGPDRRIGAGMLLALAAIALAVGGVAIAYFLTHRDSSPGVTTVVVQSTTPRATSTSAAATPTPAARKPAVPDLRGRPLADARAALDKLGLDVTTTAVTSDKEAGTIVDQTPKAGTRVAKGSMVTLSVARSSASTGTTSTSTPTTTAAQTTTSAAPPQPANATVPDVEGQKESAAAQTLSAAGILPSLVFVPSDDPLGTVERQAKSAGTTVPYHSHVQINISRGPGDKQLLSVPNTIGQTLDQAVSTLNGAHLRLIFVKLPVTSRAQAGKIVQQSPLGGGQAPENAQVLVFLGAYRG